MTFIEEPDREQRDPDMPDEEPEPEPTPEPPEEPSHGDSTPA